ncbi:MAG: hypothetical protein IAG13_07585 [Deltaproteobacteria bacterium]|nr:hypothetical protein [Nannocystaceae bacterium]
MVAGALELSDDWRALPAATPRDVAESFSSPVARRILVEALLIPACIEGEVTQAGASVVRSFARSVRVRSHWVGIVGALHRRRTWPVKRQLFARSPDARRVLARTWAEDGLGGLWRALLFVAGRHVDRPLASRFRALGELSVGTLGRQFYDDFAARGLAFPGEPGGLPERMIHHDLMHVVNGYSTDPAGECELAGFYAGFSNGDSFTFIVTALATFQLALRVSPAIVSPARGAFDPARVLGAFLRGRRLNVDVMGAWDYWALMPLPLDVVRERLGIAETAE